MLNAFTKFYKINIKQHEIMFNTFIWSLIIWEPAIETWAQEMNGGPENELGGPESWTVFPPWKLYFNPCMAESFSLTL